MRRTLGPSTSSCHDLRPRRQQPHASCAATPYLGGERYGDVPGKYYQRVRATLPADWTSADRRRAHAAAGSRATSSP